jgi:hypothetical protein
MTKPLTRRERHERTVMSFQSYGVRHADAVLIDFIRRKGLACFTDEAIELLRAEYLEDWMRHRRRNAESRALYAARQAGRAA